MNSVIDKIATARRSLPIPINHVIDDMLRLVPVSVTTRLGLPTRKFSKAQVPPPPVVPSTDVRLYVAPVNFAGQGFEWARSAEKLPGVGAVNMQYSLDRGFGFSVDNWVPAVVFNNSRAWQRTQFETVASGFTHVIFEAERPIFGTLFGGRVDLEVAALRARGVTVGMLSHGSDLRLPSRHRKIDEWSPFLDDNWGAVQVLESQSRRNLELLRGLQAPVFLSTPDLLLDWPSGIWLPLAIDLEPWRGASPPLARQKPVVVHAPSNSVIKGSTLIEPILRSLVAEGLIEYVRVEGVPASEIPALYKGADIVLEQFRIGTYSRAAVEGMAAGRIVIAHVHDQVRNHVRVRTGRELPVVQATPDTLESTVRDVVSQRDKYRSVAEEGMSFVAEVHDGRASADALKEFLSLGRMQTTASPENSRGW